MTALALRVAARWAFDTEAGGFKTLYHIGRRPPIARPKRHEWKDRGQPGDEWERPGREPLEKAVFLTDKKGLFGVVEMHGVTGHVYIYKVPQKLIAQAGGIRRYDNAREVAFNEQQWNQIRQKLVGKISADQFKQMMQDAGRGSEAAWWHKTLMRDRKIEEFRL